MKKHIIFYSVIFSVFFLLLSVGRSETGPPARILLLHSYHSDYPWVNAITRGVREVLSGEDIDLKIFYMDTKRRTSIDWKEKAGQMARDTISEWKPAIVIAADDNAQKFVTRRYAGLKSPLFIFCGVNEDPTKYGLPASNVTGLVERPYFRQSIDLALKLLPRLRTVAVISDKSPTSIGALRYMRDESIPLKVIGWNLIDDFNTWKKRIKEYCLQADALCIYMYHTLQKEKGGEKISPSEVMKWTIENCSIPTIGFFDFAIEEGLAMGVVESGEIFGRRAAEIALDLLKGKFPADIPIRAIETGIPMVNPVTFKRLGLDIPPEKLEKLSRLKAQ